MVWRIETQNSPESTEPLRAEYSAIVADYGGRWGKDGIEFSSYRAAELCAHSLTQRLGTKARLAPVPASLKRLRPQ
jgi:hypothetical protein